MLRTYSLEQTADFILWLSKVTDEEELKEVWLHSMSELGFEDWKKKQKLNKPDIRQKRKKINKEKEQEALANAQLVLGKALGKGGDSD